MCVCVCDIQVDIRAHEAITKKTDLQAKTRKKKRRKIGNQMLEI